MQVAVAGEGGAVVGVDVAERPPVRGPAATRPYSRSGDSGGDQVGARRRRRCRRADGLGRAAVCAGKIAARRRFVATEVCRRAANCAAILARVHDRLRLDIEMISTGEEARLVVTCFAPLPDPRIPYSVVFDIGGGSTAIVWVRSRHDRGGRRRGSEILSSVSVPLGVVNLMDRFVGEVAQARRETKP